MSALLGAPIAHGLHVVVHAVVFAEPIPLAGVTGQHLGFGFDDAANVHIEAGNDFPSERVLAFNSVVVIEVRNTVQGRRSTAIAQEIGRWRCKSRRSGNVTGHLVVGHVI